MHTLKYHRPKKLEAGRELVRLYGGLVTVEYHDAKHTYRLIEENGILVPDKDAWLVSATGATGMIDKPALMGWAAKMAGEYVGRALKPGVALDEVQIQQLADNCKAAHRKYSGVRKSIGNVTHEWIEKHILWKMGLGAEPDPVVNQDASKAVEAFLKWERMNSVVWLWSERIIFSRKDRYTGTCDAGALVNQTPYALDWKSGSGVYPEAVLQVTGYADAAEEEDGQPYQRGVLHVNTKTGRFKFYDEDGCQQLTKNSRVEDQEAFKAALTLKRWKLRHPWKKW